MTSTFATRRRHSLLATLVILVAALTAPTGNVLGAQALALVVSGRVVDRLGAGIPNAAIAIRTLPGGTPRVTFSDSLGEFTVLLHTAGTGVALTVSHPGFSYAERRVRVVGSPPQVAPIFLVLSPAATRLPTVAVRATRAAAGIGNRASAIPHWLTAMLTVMGYPGTTGRTYRMVRNPLTAGPARSQFPNASWRRVARSLPEMLVEVRERGRLGRHYRTHLRSKAALQGQPDFSKFKDCSPGQICCSMARKNFAVGKVRTPRTRYFSPFGGSIGKRASSNTFGIPVSDGHSPPERTHSVGLE